jgi:hypothetical protein
VLTYLEARAAAGHALPSVELVMLESEGQKQGGGEQAVVSGKRKGTGEPGDQQEAGAMEEEEVHVMLEYVMERMNEELVTELLGGFHGITK